MCVIQVLDCGICLHCSFARFSDFTVRLALPMHCTTCDRWKGCQIPPIMSYQEVSVHGRAIKATNPSSLAILKFLPIPLPERERGKGFGRAPDGSVESGSEGTDFFLGGRDGKVLVKLSRKGVRPDLHRITGRSEAPVHWWRIENGAGVPCHGGEDVDGLSVALDLPVHSHLFYPMMERWKIGPTMEPKEFCYTGVSLFCFACLFFCFTSDS